MDQKITIEYISEIREKVRQHQSFKRFEHTLGVAYTAACMAFIHHEDVMKAELSGILHDCAKCYTDEELIEMCATAGISLSPEELASPAVIHAKYGKYMAEHEFGIQDEEILNAVGFHTTGRRAMTRLEQIIFIADFIEPLRDKASNLAEARALAFTDLDECAYNILASTVDYLNGRQSLIVPETFEAYEYYKELRGHNT